MAWSANSMSVESGDRQPVRRLLPYIPLIDRYIAGRTLRPFALSLGVVLAALLLERVLRIFDLLALKGGPYSIVIEMAANLVPYYLGLALPAAFFLSVFLAIAGMGDDNELDALLATGWSITRLSRPFFAIGLAFSIFCLFLFGFLQPYTRYGYEALLYTATNAAWDAHVQPATFIDARQGMTLSADSVDISGRNLTGVFVRKQTPNGDQVTTAPEGYLLLSNKGTEINLYLENGTTLESRSGSRPYVVHFNGLKSAVNLIRGQHPFRARGDSERELTLFELRHELGDPKDAAVSPHRLASEFQGRIVRTLSLPILPLVAVPLAMAAKRRRRTSGMIIAALLLLAYQHILQLGESLADIGRVPAIPALWVPFILFTIFGVWLFRNSRERPGDNPMTHAVDWMLEFTAAIGRPFKRLRRKAAT
jgi:lipopolysaccharide export system permease protein